jgi:GT2 family glycosyltransferase
MKTSLITPVFSLTASALSMAQNCLDSLDDDRPDELIVVDDASWVPFSWSGKVEKLIRNDRNLGYVRTTNTGMKAATGDVIILGNSDLTFSKGWLKAITEPLSTYDIVALRTNEQGDEGTEDRCEEDDRIGALFAIKRSAYERLGGLDERFKHYCADNDYRRRAMNAGLKICKNHRFLVDHKGGRTYNLMDPEHSHYPADAATFFKIHGFAE